MVKYLEASPCSSQSPEVVTSFLNATKTWKVTKFEKLQILNLRPTSIVQLQLVLEEVEERFTEEEMTAMIELIEQLIPPPAVVSDAPAVPTEEPATANS